MKLPLFLGKKLNGEELIVDLTKLPLSYNIFNT